MLKFSVGFLFVFPSLAFPQAPVDLKSKGSCFEEYKNKFSGDAHLNLLVSVLDEKVTKHYGDEKIPKDRRPQIIHSPDDSELILYFFPPEKTAIPQISIFTRTRLDQVLKATLSCAAFILEVNHPTSSGGDPTSLDSPKVKTAGMPGLGTSVPKLWISKKIIHSFKGTSNWDPLFEALKQTERAGTFVRGQGATGVKELTAGGAGISRSQTKDFTHELKINYGALRGYRLLGRIGTWERTTVSGRKVQDLIIHFTEVAKK